MRHYPNFNIMAKPSGPLCNLNCKYCFYLEKESLFTDEGSHKFRMTDEIQEEYIRQYIASQKGNSINFSFQGGEPTIQGVSWFKKLVEIVTALLPPGKTVTYSLQTNGTLLNDEWGVFLKQHNWLVGISIDGPQHIHDHYRVDKRDKPSWGRVMAGIEILKKYNIDFNTLTVVNNVTEKHGKEIYQFLKNIGSNYLQFIPIVERVLPDGNLCDAPELDVIQEGYTIPEWSATPKNYGQFYIDIYDEWVRNDVGTVFVQLFDLMLGGWMGQPSTLCVFAEKCGGAAIIEHTGDVYSCDHFVYPKYHLGHINDKSLEEMMESPFQIQFGSNKKEKLPNDCLRCDFLSLCNGGCPKQRFLTTKENEPGLNYLCEGYKMIFSHAAETMKYMSLLLREGQLAAGVMEWMKHQDKMKKKGTESSPTSISAATKPNSDEIKIPGNAPCHCGSEKKYKHCHGKK